MSSWALDKKNTGSINDGGSKLPLGETIHEIVKISEQVNTQNPKGNEKQVVIETTSEGSAYKIYLSVESEVESVQNIARKTLFAFWEQAGFDEACKPERLKKLVGKFYTLTVEETKGKIGTKNEGKSFTNIKKVFAFEPTDEQEQEEEPEAAEEAPEQEEPEPEEVPKAKATPKWLQKK